MSATTHQLSAIENYFRREDCADSPMVITMRVHLAGSVDVAALTNALAQALTRHPLLRATCPGNWRPRWVVSEKCEPNLTVCSVESHPSSDCPERAIDLRVETGAVFELRYSSSEAVLLAWFHHQCVDGIGALQFLRDTFAAYDDVVLNHAVDVRPLPVPSRRVAPQTIQSVIQAIRIGFPIFRTKCVRLGRPQTITRVPANILHSRVLNRRTTKLLRQAANRMGVSLNDLCTSAFLTHLLQSHSETGKSPSDSREGHSVAARTVTREVFRLLVPVNMRRPTEEEASVANFISFLFQSYRFDEIADTDQLPRTVHRKIEAALRTNVGKSVLLFFQLVRHVPGAYRLFRWTQSRFATAVFANVGDLKRVFDHRFDRERGKVVAGNLVVERIDGVAPLRENTNLAVSCGRYAGELIFNLRADPGFVSELEATEFLAQFVGRLEESVESLERARSGAEETADSQVLSFPEPTQHRRAA